MVHVSKNYFNTTTISEQSQMDKMTAGLKYYMTVNIQCTTQWVKYKEEAAIKKNVW